MLEKYRKEIVPIMMEKMGYKNPMMVPRLEKIVINMGVGKGAHDIKLIEEAREDLAEITGQAPVVTRAKRAISNFKIKKGDPIGCKVTLRKARMYEFLDRLINVAIPRIRDFRGLSAESFDEGGSYTLGIDEQTIFPEIEYDKVKNLQGMNITLVTNAKTKEQAYLLLQLLGFPFR